MKVKTGLLFAGGESRRIVSFYCETYSKQTVLGGFEVALPIATVFANLEMEVNPI